MVNFPLNLTRQDKELIFEASKRGCLDEATQRRDYPILSLIFGRFVLPPVLKLAFLMILDCLGEFPLVYSSKVAFKHHPFPLKTSPLGSASSGVDASCKGNPKRNDAAATNNPIPKVTPRLPDFGSSCFKIWCLDLRIYPCRAAPKRPTRPENSI